MADAMPKVDAFLAALRQQSLFGDASTPGSVLWYIAYYQSRVPNRKRAFRLCGFLLLFLSISLPFITQLCPPEWRGQVASALAWLIAVVAAANSFFGWQKAWQIYTQTQLNLQFALSEWELRTAQARAAANDDDGVALLQKALQALSTAVTDAVSNETAQYFEGVKTPDVQAPRRA
jgi:vacuolar-type H+-ATPase subunit I/STV1